ncbi:MAG: DUF294 nucleotidyltransferase-like domain-containing protein [Pseudomonadales bacterium]
MSIMQENPDEQLHFIKVLPPFDCLDDMQLQLVAQHLESEQFKTGVHVLAQNGPPSQYLYIVRSGAMRLVHNGQVAQVLAPGQIFGYPSMLNKDASSFDVVAEDDVLLYRIPEQVFRSLLENARFTEFFLKNLSEGLRRTSQVEMPSLSGDFTTLIGDLITHSPVMIEPDASVADVAAAMRTAGVDAALVTSEPPGIITDRDFLARVLAESRGPETPVTDVMSQPVRMQSVDTPVYAALLYMLEHDVHHLALEQNGQIVGVISADDLLRHQARNPLYFLRELENLENPDESLSRYALNVASTVETLFKGGLDVAQIGRTVASLNATLIRRLLKMAEQDLGPPPTEYAWIVFGSEGRMEQMLLTDQDNALVYKDDTEAARRYFKALAEKAVNGLIHAGIPSCPGGYMATNWCKPLAEWLTLFEGWLNSPDPKALLEACVFFDFRALHGDLSLQALENVLFETGEKSIFLAHMSQMALEFPPPLTMFRRIRSERGQVDIKKGGVAAIVATARFFALEAGAHSRSTFDRLDTAAVAGKLSRDGAESMAETYRFLLQLRLREQLAAIKAGEIADNKVRLQELSALETHRLKDAFTAIKDMQEFIGARF